MKKLLLAASMLAALALPAKADVVLGGQAWSFNGVDTLTLTPVVPGGNQPLNVQCVICGANQPQQAANFGYTDFGNAGNQSSEIYFSTNVFGGANPGSNTIGIGYDIGFLQAYLLANGNGSLNFTIGVDVNDTNNPQTLQSFFLLNLTTKTVLAAFTTPTSVPSQNNGTGFPDYTLSGFNLDFGTDIHIGDKLLFFANIQNANDGPDSFFIQATPVPGPIVGAGIPGLIMAGLGMLGFNRARRKRLGTA